MAAHVFRHPDILKLNTAMKLKLICLWAIELSSNQFTDYKADLMDFVVVELRILVVSQIMFGRTVNFFLLGP